MRFAKILFLVAGIYGLVALVPQYFLEERNNLTFPPPITHPEYYYGFVGLGVVWQVLFLVLSRDPVRYRPMMIPSVLEKASFGLAVLVLVMQHRTPAMMLAPATIDLVLGALFAVAYFKTARAPEGLVK